MKMFLPQCGSSATTPDVSVSHHWPTLQIASASVGFVASRWLSLQPMRRSVMRVARMPQVDPVWSERIRCLQIGSTEREQPNGGAGSETAADGDGSLSPENPHDSSTVDLDCKADKAAVLDGPVGGDETNTRDACSAQTDAKETSQQGQPDGF